MVKDLSGDNNKIKKYSALLAELKMPIIFRDETGPARTDDLDRVIAALPTELQREIDPELTIIEHGRSSYHFPFIDEGYVLIRTRENKIIYLSLICGEEKLTIAVPGTTLS